MTQRWMQAGNKMRVPKEASRYHQEEFSFKGGSHPDNLIPTFFLAFPISRTRFLLRVVVCNDPGFYQILGKIFRFCIAWDDWNFTGI
jgi:hypothetical protein